MEKAINRPGGSASDVVSACECAWRSFQAQHPDLPDAVIILGSGVDRGRLVKLGHWWGGRWQAGDEIRGEVLLAGEALNLPVEDVFEVLLHEAAHGLNAVRGIKDVSRGGRYHNARFKATAIEVGLDVEMMPPYGWAKTSMTPEALKQYAVEIADLKDAIRIARRIDDRRSAGITAGDGEAGTTSPERTKSPPMSCGCGRKMRMAPSVAAQGPVLCGMCGVEFTIGGAEIRPASEIAELVHLRPAIDAPPDRVTPEFEEALTMVVDSLRSPEGFAAVSRAMAWPENLSTSTGAALCIEGDDPIGINEVAHAVQRVRGLLNGPDIAAGVLRLAAGDLVVVAHPAPADSDLVPDVGVLGQVVAADPAQQSIVVDFPICGLYRLSATEAGTHLVYGYALPDDLAVRPHRIVPQPPTPERAEQLAEVIELGIA